MSTLTVTTSPRRRGRLLTLAVPLAAAALVAAGCADDQGGGSGGASDAGAVAEAKQVVEQYSGDQAPVEVAPLQAAPESGLTLGILTCEFPACKQTADGAAAAATALGWDTELITTAITPEDYRSAWGRLMDRSPDVITYAGLMPNEMVKDFLGDAKDAGIPVAAMAASDQPSDLMPAVTVGSAQLAESGRLMGTTIVADSASAPKVLFVWDPAQKAIFGPVKDALEDEVEDAGGTLETLDIQSANTGKTVPGQVASALQADPDIAYVAFTIADFTAGVPEALAASSSKVKIISRSPSLGNLENIRDGKEWAGVAEESVAGGWRAVDAILRQQQGMTFEANPAGWHRIYTRDNLGDDLAADLLTPGVPDAFTTAWAAK